MQYQIYKIQHISEDEQNSNQAYRLARMITRANRISSFLDSKFGQRKRNRDEEKRRGAPVFFAFCLIASLAFLICPHPRFCHRLLFLNDVNDLVSAFLFMRILAICLRIVWSNPVAMREKMPCRHTTSFNRSLSRIVLLCHVCSPFGKRKKKKKRKTVQTYKSTEQKK